MVRLYKPFNVYVNMLALEHVNKSYRKLRYQGDYDDQSPRSVSQQRRTYLLAPTAADQTIGLTYQMTATSKRCFDYINPSMSMLALKVVYKSHHRLLDSNLLAAR
jgi:hypothetical protein